MCWQYNILKKLKSWKLGGKMLQFISDFMRERTLRVAVGSTFSDDWMIHTTQQQQRVATIRIQKTMNRINKRAEDTGFQGVDGENQSYQVQPNKISNNHQTQNEHMGKRRENRPG
jgi:hypothetical protein